MFGQKLKVVKKNLSNLKCGFSILKNQKKEFKQMYY